MALTFEQWLRKEQENDENFNGTYKQISEQEDERLRLIWEHELHKWEDDGGPVRDDD